MGFCPNCNIEYDGEFCTTCGRHLGYSSQSRSNAVSLVKSAGASTLFLAAVIAQTATLLFQLLQAFTPVSIMNSLGPLTDQYSDMFGDFDISAFAGTFESVYTVSTLVGMILPALICAGMWMFYIMARNRDDSTVSTSGLTMIKVSMIISYSFAFLMMAAVMIVLLGTAGLSGMAEGFEGEFIAGFIIGFGIIFAIIAVLMIFYFIGLLKTINIAVRALRTGVISGKPSMFVVVFNYIVAGFTAISALTTLGSGMVLTAIGSLCSAATLIIVSICIASFKTQMLNNR